MAKKKPANGNNGNNGGQDDPDDDDDAGGLTDGMRTEITNLVNAAVSGQLSRKLPNAITGALEAGLKPLQDQIASLGGSRRGSDDDDPNDDDDDQQQQRGKKGKQGQQPRSKDPEVVAMQKRMAQIEAERKQERETARNRERDTLLREQLEAAGVDKNRIRGAVAVLRDSMKYDDKAGEWTYSAKREGFEDVLDVSAGVGEWAATDEGKSYLAPPSNGQGQQQRSGSGVRPTNPGGGAPRLQNGGRPAVDPKAAKQQAKAAAIEDLSKAIGSLGGGTIPLG